MIPRFVKLTVNGQTVVIDLLAVLAPAGFGLAPFGTSPFGGLTS